MTILTSPSVSSIVNFFCFFNTFYRTWRASGHGQNSLHIFEYHCFGGVTICCRLLWGVPRKYYTMGRTSLDSWFVYIFVFKNFLFWSVVSGTSWDFIDNDLARDCRRALDCEVTVHPFGTATRQHTHQASSAYTRVQHRVQANAITGPLTQPASGNGGNTGFVQGHGVPSAPASSASVSSLTQMEIDLFTRLANGLGLSQYDTLGFLEKCNNCSNFFLGSFLCIISHLPHKNNDV